MKLAQRTIDELAVRGKLEEFRISLQNLYSVLIEDAYINVLAMNDNLTGIITERMVEVGGKIFRQDTGKLFQETKYLLKRPQRHEAF